MKFIFLLTLFFSLTSLASNECLPIDDASFAAEKIEKNPITGKIQLYFPSYTDESGNKLYFWTIYNGSMSEKVLANNICAYFGLTGEKIISNRDIKIRGRMLIVLANGSYMQSDRYSGYKNITHQVECSE